MGVLFEGGLIKGAVINFAPKGRNFFEILFKYILYDLEYNPRGSIYFWRSKVGVLFEGGLIDGAKFFTFFSQKYPFLCCSMMKYSLYCLLNMSLSIVVKLKLSYFKINQLFNKKKYKKLW